MSMSLSRRLNELALLEAMEHDDHLWYLTRKNQYAEKRLAQDGDLRVTPSTAGTGAV